MLGWETYTIARRCTEIVDKSGTSERFTQCRRQTLGNQKKFERMWRKASGKNGKWTYCKK